VEFTSLVFLAIFLPITMGAYLAVPRAWRLAVLCLFSLIFYASAGWLAFVFLVVSILWGYATTLLLEWRRTRAMLALSIAVPLLILLVAKYLPFMLQVAGAGPETRALFEPLLKISLPPGVSFYTFHIVCYAIDAYDGKFRADRSLLSVSTYIAFFPQLIAGPITRYLEIGPQLKALREPDGPRADYPLALKLISIGLFGKILFADMLGTFVGDRDIPQTGGSLEALFDILAYSFQIYYDFWAYSLMAIGLALLFGIKLPKNFDQPYLTRNPKEFWRRWHITLSFWMRDYVYLRLGGNRAYVRNIIIVFLVVGLWHGAGWNFILWGAYHAFLVLLYHALRDYWDRLPNPFQIGLNFSLVSLGWPLFKYDLTRTLELWQALFSFRAGSFSFSATHWVYLGLVALVTFTMKEKEWIYTYAERRMIDSAIVHAALAMLAIVFFPFARTFIYFQF
jgi:alginate O-acetyltransferase complex protein AlgI